MTNKDYKILLVDNESDILELLVLLATKINKVFTRDEIFTNA